VAAVFVEPGDGVGIGAAVGGHGLLARQGIGYE
jgi:hypothetical protein